MTTEQKKDMARAEELLRTFSQSFENLKELSARIKNEVDAYKSNMKEAEKELLEIGERVKPFFVDGNLRFDSSKGYLHIANNTVITTGKKFNWHDFLDQKGDYVKIEFKTKELKDAWLDSNEHNELIDLGVNVDTDKVIEVKVSEK